ncbi:MAG: hypothetical protein ASARMPREDX12_009109 [Alectoria sarmentosa]|nr:MAG: hypothetical protein ASARMPREDX12_009109 [Alectoria sarmentosa]
MFLSSTYIGSTILLLSRPTLTLHLPPVPAFVASMPLPVLLPTNKTSPVPASPVPDFSALPLNSSLDVGYPHPICDGNLLGFDMNRYSCLQAWSSIPTAGRMLAFGDRLSGTFNVQLPRRFSGPDGTCVIDIFHKDGVVSDVASYYQLSHAAESLYGACVARGGQRTQGGWVRDLAAHHQEQDRIRSSLAKTAATKGTSKNLVVVLSLYEPAVACFGPQFAMRHVGQTLQNLLSVLPVSTAMQLFGPEGEPGVQVVVPATYHESSPDPSPGGRGFGVRLRVDVAHRNSVKARWFDVWAGAVAVAAMCSLRGYAGISGLPSGLGVTLEAVMGIGMGNETAGE